MLALLDRLTFLRKFLLLGLIGAVAVGVPATLQVQRVWADYVAANSEQAGVVPAELVLHAMHYVLEMRDLAGLGRVSGVLDRAAIEKSAGEVTTSLRELDAVLRGDARFVEAQRRAGAASSLWAAAQSANDPAAFAAVHGSLDAVLDAVRDESGYSYTPHRDAFHMQLGLLSYAPEAEAAVSLLRDKGIDVLARLEQAELAAAAVSADVGGEGDGLEPAAGNGEDATAMIRAELQSLRALADMAARRQRVYERELEKVIALNPEFAQTLGKQHDQVEEALDEALRVAGSVANGQSIPAQRWFEQISVALLAQHEFNDTAIEALSAISARHAEEARKTLVGLGVLLAVLMGSGLMLVTAVTVSILRGVRRAQKGAEEIATLHLDNDLRSTARDEIGALLRALGTMQDDLKRRIESERRIAQENARVRAALDTASSGVMIADGDGVVVYMNRAVEKMLTEAQASIRASLPHFAVDKVIGSKFDLWHTASGGHHAKMDHLTKTHTARIRLGDRVLELFVNPVRDAAGVRVGTSLEWLDRTAESAFRHGLRNVVQRAAAGFLNARVEVKVEDERFIELAEIVNNLIGTTEKAVGEVETVMSALAKGNLAVRSDAVLLGRFGELNDNANATSEALAGVISEIQSVVGEINSAASEIAQGNGDLSRRTEQAAASIEETAAALHQVNGMVASAAQNAGEAKTLAGRAAETAADGGEVVKQVVRTMQAIRESSKQMSEIISVIDGIAFQTNILALNAAVEAARAGEQGRGFAVVASEVRALAQRSAEAAKQISGLIRDAEQRVEGGATLVQQAGERMDSIVGSARQVADIIADIAAGAVEQSKGIGEVNAAVEQLDQATQANAALVEEMAASAQALSQQASALNGVAARFVLDNPGKARAPAQRLAGSPKP